MSKEQAKQVQCRPDWLANDRDWDLFKDYRDSQQSADELAPLYQLSRAQVQNIVRKILSRAGRPGELSQRAINVLKAEGLTLQPEQLRRELEELYVRALLFTNQRGLESYLTEHVENCGPKTTQEIVNFYESMSAGRSLNPAA